MFANLKSFAFSLSTPALLRLEEIHRNDLFGDLLSNRRNFLVFGMIVVMIETGAIGKMRDEAGVK